MILNGDILLIKLWHSIRVYSSKIASGLKAQINKSNLLENKKPKKKKELNYLNDRDASDEKNDVLIKSICWQQLRALKLI